MIEITTPVDCLRVSLVAIIVTCSKKLIHLVEWLVNHEILPAELLVLWTLWIGEQYGWAMTTISFLRTQLYLESFTVPQNVRC